MQKRSGNTRGITLIALVITIIVLLILAGVTINALSGDNGILKRATEAKQKTSQAQKDEEDALATMVDAINGAVPSQDGYSDSKKVNSPKVTRGMIPVKWVSNNWVVCSEDDPKWYYYDSSKQWANVMLSDGTYKADTVKVGQVVEEKDLGSMYVWIPRYAYQIVGEKNIKVTFLKGNSNEGVDGVKYTTDQSTDTTKTAIVHPGFNLGGTQLRGFWTAKFEASGTNKDGKAVGNASSSSGSEQYAPDSTTIAKSLPNKISWRHVSIGESEKRSMDITTIAKSSYGLTNGTSHLIKNSEWGAVAYLCYSDYGSAPMTNGAGSINSSPWYIYDAYTGQGPKSSSDEGNYAYDTTGAHNYSTSNGVLSSTTGNVTGIYDMAGGAWERVAGYLDNGNGNLDTYGKSADESVKYFENGKLNSAYTSIWDSYEVSDEEKNNSVMLTDGTTVTGLWDWNKRSSNYQEARLKLTKYNFEKMAKHKGIGVNEVSSSFSFYAPYSPGTANNSQPWGWFTTVAEATAGTQKLATTWDNDYVLIGHLALPFVVRGGGCNDGSSAGVLYSYITYGYPYDDGGFRAVLVV